jgi:hypothetical protein
MDSGSIPPMVRTASVIPVSCSFPVRAFPLSVSSSLCLKAVSRKKNSLFVSKNYITALEEKQEKAA